MGHGKRGGKKRNGKATAAARQRRDQRRRNRSDANDILEMYGTERLPMTSSQPYRYIGTIIHSV